MLSLQRKAREAARPAPVYQPPDTALLSAAPPLHSLLEVTAVHKLGRPRHAPRAKVFGVIAPLDSSTTLSKQYEACYSARARQAAAHVALATKTPPDGSLSPDRPASPVRPESVRGTLAPGMLDGVHLYQKQQWMKGWLEARGGVGPSEAKQLDSLQLRQVGAGSRLLQVQARRLASADEHTTGAR
jgi:hypothetical protein